VLDGALDGLVQASVAAEEQSRMAALDPRAQGDG